MVLSVALCTFNGESFLEQQLNSILEQSEQVNEIVICDDGSTDRTLKILKAYEKKFSNVIKLYTNNVSLGTIKNFEKAISLTTGDLIFLADQDDIWRKDKVAIMNEFFNLNKNCKLLFSDGDLIDENGGNLNATLWEKWGFNANMQNKWIDNKNAFQDLIINNNKITGATVCFHKSLKEVVLPIEVPYGYWHDVWLGIHASANDGLMYENQSLISYRIHKNQQVGVKTDFEKVILDISNPNPVQLNKFYKFIKKKYPLINRFVPIEKNKSIKKRLKLKIQNILKRIFLGNDNKQKI